MQGLSSPKGWNSLAWLSTSIFCSPHLFLSPDTDLPCSVMKCCTSALAGFARHHGEQGVWGADKIPCHSLETDPYPCTEEPAGACCLPEGFWELSCVTFAFTGSEGMGRAGLVLSHNPISCQNSTEQQRAHCSFGSAISVWIIKNNPQTDTILASK